MIFCTRFRSIWHIFLDHCVGNGRCGTKVGYPCSHWLIFHPKSISQAIFQPLWKNGSLCSLFELFAWSLCLSRLNKRLTEAYQHALHTAFSGLDLEVSATHNYRQWVKECWQFCDGQGAKKYTLLFIQNFQGPFVLCCLKPCRQADQHGDCHFLELILDLHFDFSIYGKPAYRSQVICFAFKQII